MSLPIYRKYMEQGMLKDIKDMHSAVSTLGSYIGITIWFHQPKRNKQKVFKCDIYI